MSRTYEKQLNIRLTKPQLAAVEKAASKAGMSASGWIREVALATAGATHLSVVGRLHDAVGGRASVDDQIKTVRAVFVSRKRGGWLVDDLIETSGASRAATRAAITQLEDEGLAKREVKSASKTEKGKGRGRPKLYFVPVKS